MKLKLVCTSEGFKCYEDEDFEKKKTLKRGTVVEATIKEYRNIKFHRLYFALINCAWEYLTEQQRAFFKEKVDLFRETVQIAAGHYETCYSLARQEWFEKPKSIAFDKLTEAEFHDLYERVKNVIYSTFIPNISKKEFEENLRLF